MKLSPTKSKYISTYYIEFFSFVSSSNSNLNWQEDEEEDDD